MSPEEDALVRVVRALESEAVGVLEVNPKLDRAYIERWVRELGIMDLWQEITAQRPPQT